MSSWPGRRAADGAGPGPGVDHGAGPGPDVDHGAGPGLPRADHGAGPGPGAGVFAAAPDSDTAKGAVSALREAGRRDRRSPSSW
jgi:hypothetical protein